MTFTVERVKRRMVPGAADVCNALRPKGANVDAVVAALNDLAERARTLPRHKYDMDMFHTGRAQLGADILVVAEWLRTGKPPR